MQISRALRLAAISSVALCIGSGPGLDVEVVNAFVDEEGAESPLTGEKPRDGTVKVESVIVSDSLYLIHYGDGLSAERYDLSDGVIGSSKKMEFDPKSVNLRDKEFEITSLMAAAFMPWRADGGFVIAFTRRHKQTGVQYYHYAIYNQYRDRLRVSVPFHTSNGEKTRYDILFVENRYGDSLYVGLGRLRRQHSGDDLASVIFVDHCALALMPGFGELHYLEKKESKTQ